MDSPAGNAEDTAAMARKLSEQRLSSRIAMGAPAALQWADQRATGFVENVSLGGLYVASKRLPELGEYVDLQFALPANGRTFRVRVSVVHMRRSGFGARFERPPLGLLEAIRGLTREH